MKVPASLLKKYLEDFHDDKIDKKGNEWIMPSIENPKKQKLYINIERAFGHDKIGGKGYNAFQLIQALEGLEKADTERFIKDYRFKYLGKISFETDDDYTTRKKEPVLIQRIALPEHSKPVWDKDSEVAALAMSYLKNRGINETLARKLFLHVGLTGNYRRRIIIPFIENGEIVWYQGRAIYDTKLRYLNPKGVDRKMLVYNIDNMEDRAIIMEGPFDACLVNGQAIMGSTISDWQAGKILSKKPTEIVVVVDEDETKWNEIRKIKVNPGYIGAIKTIETFAKLRYPIKQIKVVFVEGGKDFNEIGLEKANQAVDNAQRVTLSTLIKFKEKGATSEHLTKII